MIKYYCNRCKKEIEKKRANFIIAPNMMSDRKFSFDGIPSEYSIDLCPDCFNQFNRFVTKQQILDVK